MPPFFMAHTVDGTEVTGAVAQWSADQALDPLAAAAGGQKYILEDDLETVTGPKSLTNDDPPGYTVTGMPDNSQGFAGSGASGPLGGDVTKAEGDVLGITIKGGATAEDTTKSAVATATENGSGKDMTVDLTVKKGIGVTEAKVKAVGSGYVVNERLKVAKADAGTTNDVILYVTA